MSVRTWKSRGKWLSMTDFQKADINTVPNRTVPQNSKARRIGFKEGGLVITKGALSRENLVNIKIALESPSAKPLENPIRHPVVTRLIPPTLPGCESRAKELPLNLSDRDKELSIDQGTSYRSFGQCSCALIVGVTNVVSDQVHID